jgi:hypothetical protein
MNAESLPGLFHDVHSETGEDVGERDGRMQASRPARLEGNHEREIERPTCDPLLCRIWAAA